MVWQLLPIGEIPSPTNEIANWQTYNDKEYGYEIKYPNDWQFGPDWAPYFSSNCDFNSGELCQQIYIYIGANSNSLDYKPYFIISKDDKILNKVNMEVDENQAIGFDYFQANYGSDLPINGRWLYVIVMNHKSIKYTFTYEESQKNKEIESLPGWQKKNTFDQILSTFKFID